MMGYSHAVTATAAWLALNQFSLLGPLDIPTLAVTACACAGAGILPDIDHKNGTIAHSLPPFSQWISEFVGTVSGGHRKGTHSIVGIACFWLFVTLVAQFNYHGIPWISILLAAYSGGLALRMFGAPGGWFGAVALGYFSWSTDSLGILPWAVGVGASTHIIGDFLTTRGINLFWPFTIKPVVSSPLWRKSGYMALPLLGDSGSKREHILSSLCIIYIGWSALSLVIGTPLFSEQSLVFSLLDP